MKKKMLALVMTLAMVLSLVPVTALAKEDITQADAQVQEDTGTGDNPVENPREDNVDTLGDSKGNDSGNNSGSSDANSNENGEAGSDESKRDENGNPSKDENIGTGNNEGEEKDPPAEVSYVAKNLNTSTTYDTLTEALANAEAGNTVELAKNTQENIKIDKSVTIDLGGYTLTGTGEGTVVKISGKDSEVTVKNGTVTGGNNTSHGGGFEIQSGKVTIENCTVEKNQAQNAGGVYITGSANVKIINCEVNNNEVSNSGGAIYQASGAVNNQYYDSVCEIIDTKLQNNRAMIGGAVGMGASLFHDGITNANGGKGVTATFIMSGDSEITGNTASYRGGAVYLTGNGSRFQMQDGTISDNAANGYEGGAIWATNYGGVTINKGIICNNKAKTYGGAIYIKGNISDINASAKLAVETGLRDILNLGDVLVTGNSAKQGGAIYIDSYSSAFGIKADLREASIYGNHASVKGDDLASTGAGTEGCIVQLGDTSSDWKLTCGDSVDNWYMDGMEVDENQYVKRWNGHPSKGDLYTQKYTERENLTGVLALKAAHGPIGKVTYVVEGEIPEQYKDKIPAEESYVLPSKYTVAEVFPSVSGVNENGVNGTFSFSGWSLTKGGAQITGEQELTGDVTLYGVWTFTKKSSGHRPSNPTIDIPDDDVPTGLDLKNHYGYIIGYPVDYYTGEPTTDQTKKPVRPEGKITRAEVATIYFRMLTEENRAANWNQVSGFSDVKRSAWYNNAISTLTKAGILKGYEDGTFQPNGYITRAEFATIAIRFFNGVYEGEDLFPDIKDHWARDYINNAADKGLVKGYEDGTFGPDRYITRAEAVTLVNRTLNRHPHNDGLHEDMLVWPDNMDKTKWYYADMQEATNSHEPDKDKTDAQTEYWSKMLPIRDWEALEKEWSNANSAPGEGEVV